MWLTPDPGRPLCVDGLITRGMLAGMTSRAIAVLLSPVLGPQAWRVRRRTPVLSEAGGVRDGTVDGPPGTTLRLLVLGESTAVGVGVSDQRDALGFRLAVDLARIHNTRVVWHVVGRTGADVRAVTSQLLGDLPGELDLIVVVLGVNDTLRLSSPRAWRTEVTRLVITLRPRLLPGGRIALLGVPDFGAIPALPRPLRTVLCRHGRVLDRELVRIATDDPRVVHVPAPPLPTDDVYAADRFHPSAVGYTAWARHIASEVS